jgi:predicted O-methyltransferase YrrM
MENFIGTKYRLADNWHTFMPPQYFSDKPINYLEIGAFYGANLLSVAESYAKHINSKLFAIDPWQDYADYPEYKNEQEIIFETYKKNIENSEFKDKITTIRGYSNFELLNFDDNYFDIIYIDGNHEPEYVLEDAVLSIRKLKSGGYIIFDDYGWGGPDLTKRGIDAFIHAYYKKISLIGMQNSQVFVRKM